jgi:hypothetical protein
VAHFPLHAQGFISVALSLFTGKAGLLNRDWLPPVPLKVDPFLPSTVQLMILVQLVELHSHEPWLS